ncbi:hypothetical protein MMC17_004522 [Xylographa soralifera]|nr:hypothetical protein [Xylographa soralifera]
MVGNGMYLHGNADVHQDNLHLNDFGQHGRAGHTPGYGLPLPSITDREYFLQIGEGQNQAHGLPMPPFTDDRVFPRPRGGGAPSGYTSPTAESWESSPNAHENSSEGFLADRSQPRIYIRDGNSDHEISSRQWRQAPQSPPLDVEVASATDVISGRAFYMRSPVQKNSRRSGRQYRQSFQRKPPVEATEVLTSRSSDDFARLKSETDHGSMNGSLKRERRQPLGHSNPGYAFILGQSKGPAKNIFGMTSTQDSRVPFQLPAVVPAGPGVTRARRLSGLRQPRFDLATNRKDLECRRRHIPRRSIRNGVYRRHRGISPLWRPYPTFRQISTHNPYKGIGNTKGLCSWPNQFAGFFRRTGISLILGLYWLTLVVLFLLAAAADREILMEDAFIMRFLVLACLIAEVRRGWCSVCVTHDTRRGKTDPA